MPRVETRDDDPEMGMVVPDGGLDDDDDDDDKGWDHVHEEDEDKGDDDEEDDDEAPPQAPRAPQAQRLELTSGLSLDTVTTFRDDVRTEWIHAVFGTDVLAALSGGGGGGSGSYPRTRLHRGMGLAHIAPYTAYQVSIPAAVTATPFSSTSTTTTSSTTSPRSNSHVNGNNASPSNHPSSVLGISIARLALGLYVRHIQPGSEACCAGVVVNSVLVSINGMNLLAEPSKQALERLWQYEGHLQPPHYVEKEKDQDHPHQTPMLAATTAPATTTTTKTKTKTKTKTTKSSSSTPLSTSGQDSLLCPIQHPLHMTFIHQGRLYSVVFLSNPPYGMDWAPCGNFALVKRSYAHAQQAGVLKGSIIANITSSVQQQQQQQGDILDLDHTSAASTLKALLTTSPSNDNNILLTLCIPPSEARSGHYERSMDAAAADADVATLANRTLSTATTTTRTNAQKSTTNPPYDQEPNHQDGSRWRRRWQQPHQLYGSNSHKLQRAQVVAQHDGVEIRVHPLLFSPSSCSNNGAHLPCPNPFSFNNNNHNNHNNNNTAMVSSAAAMKSLSQLAFRVAAGEFFSFANLSSSTSRQQQRRRRYQYYFSQRYYRSCPPLDRSLTELWSAEDSLMYLMHYQNASYDERHTIMGSRNSASPYRDGTKTKDCSKVYSFLRKQSPRRARQSVESFLLPILALLKKKNTNTNTNTTTRQTNDQDSSSLQMFLLQLAYAEDSSNHPYHHGDSLAHRMEFMAQALELIHMREQLAEARNQRMEQARAAAEAAATTLTSNRRRQPRQIPIRVERAPELASSSSPVAASTATGTTASAMTLSSIVSSSHDLDHPLLLLDETKVTTQQGLFGFFRKKKRKSLIRRKLATMGGDKNKHHPNRKTKTSSTVPHPPTATPEPNATNGHSASFSPNAASSSSVPSATIASVYQPSPPRSVTTDPFFANTLRFLEELEAVCLDIEKSFLLRSFSQKIAGWALQPWSASKETELAQVTQVMRERLRQCPTLPLLNPIDLKTTLVSVDAQGSYILPSAHVPLLLTFDCQNDDDDETLNAPESNSVWGREQLYRTKVELVELKGLALTPEENGRAFTVHGSVGGTVMESGPRYVRTSFSVGDVERCRILTVTSRFAWKVLPPIEFRISMPGIKVTC